MRVAIDATPLGSGLGGDETLLTGILRGLAAVAQPDDTFVLLASPGAELPADIDGNPSFVVARGRRRPGAVHFAVSLPRWLGSLDPVPDVVFTMTHAPARSPAPVALMLPDLSFHHHPEFFPRSTRLRLRTLVPRQARSASTVLTISEFSRRDLIDSYELDPERVVTIPLTIDPPDARGDAVLGVDRRLAEAGVVAPFVLYLGNVHPRKNVARAIRAFLAAQRDEPALADHCFVVAGGRWFAGSDEEQVAAGAPAGRVRFLGRVSDDLREALLRRAAALVYPSLFEGFGLPPLEAMARSTPVVAASCTAIPEVCGDAALLVDPYDEVAIAGGLVDVLTDADCRERLVAAGHERVAHYRVDATGRAARAGLAAACELRQVDAPA
jgi:glycosyltransferase involved in cell wall biosynthesis